MYQTDAYWESKFSLLLEISEPSVDNGPYRVTRLCSIGHQPAIDSIRYFRWARHKDNCTLGDAVNLVLVSMNLNFEEFSEGNKVHSVSDVWEPGRREPRI